MSKQTPTNSTRSMDRSHERVVAQKIRDMAADIENFGTNNGKRQLDERWARGAIDRARKDLLKTYLPGKQYGVMASAKVAVSKAESLDDLRKAADKLESFQSKPDQENKPKKTAAKQNLSVPPGWKLVPTDSPLHAMAEVLS